LKAFFSEISSSKSQTDGIVLRNPTAWYYQTDAFFHKKVEIIFCIGDSIGDPCQPVVADDHKGGYNVAIESPTCKLLTF
jgi:hypothetical protein